MYTQNSQLPQPLRPEQCQLNRHLTLLRCLYNLLSLLRRMTLSSPKHHQWYLPSQWLTAYQGLLHLLCHPPKYSCRTSLFQLVTPKHHVLAAAHVPPHPRPPPPSPQSPPPILKAPPRPASPPLSTPSASPPPDSPTSPRPCASCATTSAPSAVR